MFFLQPSNDKVVNAGETRSSNNVTVMLMMNKMFPNPAVDFKGRIFIRRQLNINYVLECLV